ncbi:MAG: PEP motif putative anchor domain-containing protein [Methanolobus sp. T82-4]|nr:MAG: PEP motif putative anchor domain-containing protein [Methanolobus sp. T82-4]
MKNVSVLKMGLLVLIMSILVNCAVADPVQYAGNGHYYELVSEKMTWKDAKVAAEGMSITIDGVQMQGHLATITSAEENAFIFDTFNVGYSWLGGYQPEDPTDSSEPDSSWTWVTGEPWEYTNWKSGEPNDYKYIPEGEDFLTTWSPKYTWNDYQNTRSCSYIVEYEPIEDSESPETIPEYPSIILPIAAILGLSLVFGRRKM